MANDCMGRNPGIPATAMGSGAYLRDNRAVLFDDREISGFDHSEQPLGRFFSDLTFQVCLKLWRDHTCRGVGVLL